MLGVGIELLRVRVLETHRAGRLDDHGLQAQAQAEQRDLVGAGETDRAELALDATNTEPARDQDGVDSADSGPGTFLVSHSSDGTHEISTFERCAKPPARSASVTDR